MSGILSVPHFRQSVDGYCLPACARMVLAYLGINRSEAEISQVLIPNSKLFLVTPLLCQAINHSKKE